MLRHRLYPAILLIFAYGVCAGQKIAKRVRSVFTRYFSFTVRKFYHPIRKRQLAFISNTVSIYVFKFYTGNGTFLVIAEIFGIYIVSCYNRQFISAATIITGS